MSPHILLMFVPWSVGSMVRAVNGMFEEQHSILYSFVLSIIAFAVMMTIYFWIVMTTLGATVGSIIVFLSSFVWYHYFVRIVNRFQWNESSISWGKHDMPDALYKVNYISDPNTDSNSNPDCT